VPATTDDGGTEGVGDDKRRGPGGGLRWREGREMERRAAAAATQKKILSPGLCGGDAGINFLNSSERTIHSSVNRRMHYHIYLSINRPIYSAYVRWFQIPCSILISRNIVHLYSSVQRNIKKSRNVSYFPVVTITYLLKKLECAPVF
jgi:hypothetical protein